MISLHGNNKEVYVDYASEHPMISPHSNNEKEIINIPLCWHHTKGNQHNDKIIYIIYTKNYNKIV